jgi:hypothetical protein
LDKPKTLTNKQQKIGLVSCLKDEQVLPSKEKSISEIIDIASDIQFSHTHTLPIKKNFENKNKRDVIPCLARLFIIFVIFHCLLNEEATSKPLSF